jgi:hypothetical protein
MTAELVEDMEVNWINTRMRKLLAEDFCPVCGKHRKLHDNDACPMRYVKEEDNG